VRAVADEIVASHPNLVLSRSTPATAALGRSSHIYENKSYITMAYDVKSCGCTAKNTDTSASDSFANHPLRRRRTRRSPGVWPPKGPAFGGIKGGPTEQHAANFSRPISGRALFSLPLWRQFQQASKRSCILA
jgi:hypothetical protein